jgi:hypothetical protein
MRIPAFVGCLLACSSPMAFAAHPLTSEDTGTQGNGNWQLEVNADRAKERDTSNANIVANATLARGLGETIDFGVNLPWQRLQNGDDPRETQRGFGDASIFIKWRLYEQDKLSVALKPMVTVPTGDSDKGLGTDRSQTGINSIASWGDDTLTVLANAGYTYADNKVGDRKDILNASTAALFGVAEHFRVIGELGTNSNSDMDSAKWPAFANVGVIYSPTDKLDLDIGYRHGLNKAADLYSFGAGVTVRW